ncbi:MAG: energy transducer TonB [Candidatus Kapaibacterium sp.]
MIPFVYRFSQISCKAMTRIFRNGVAFLLIAGVARVASGQQKPSRDTGFSHFVFTQPERQPQDSNEAHSRFVNLDVEPHELKPLERLIQYPEVARRMQLEGVVSLAALIDKSGMVDKVNILRSSDPLFSQEAIRAMKSEKFSPAMQHGTPIKIWITRTIHFRLNAH